MLLADPTEVEQAIKITVTQAAQQLIDAGKLSLLPLSDFVDQIWANVRATENNPRTWKREQRFAWEHIKPALGHVRMDKLDSARWAAFLASKPDWSGRTKALVQTAYRCCLRYAQEIGVLSQVHAFRTIKGGNKPTLATPDNLSDPEIKLLLDAAATPMHRCLYACTFALGCRPAEITQVNWSGVDWLRGTIHIPGGKTTRSNRIIPLTQLAGEELHKWWELAGKPTEGLVFQWRGKEIGSWIHGYREAIKRAGLKTEGRRLVPYSARYTFAAQGVLGGRADAVSAEMMGHAPGSRVTQRTYQRLRPDQVRQALGAAAWKPTAPKVEETPPPPPLKTVKRRTKKS
ncbi:MAG TPA: site-specific integrase [Myxococcota bacterium]|nr:site-specific integrase [Myxococcota bacterium]